MYSSLQQALQRLGLVSDPRGTCTKWAKVLVPAEICALFGFEVLGSPLGYSDAVTPQLSLIDAVVVLPLLAAVNLFVSLLMRPRWIGIPLALFNVFYLCDCGYALTHMVV